MGKEGQPKHRQAARELLRRKAQLQPAERLLIVCEGSKTEPLYLGEIRQQLRLPSANVQVQPAAYGTEPLRIVEYAERLFTEGQRALGIHARTFDRVVVVFDRDDGTQPYTNMHERVHRLLHLKDQAA
jgi:RloB-like protein